MLFFNTLNGFLLHKLICFFTEAKFFKASTFNVCLNDNLKNIVYERLFKTAFDSLKISI